MAKKKDGLSTTMQHSPSAGVVHQAGAVMDHNMCPVFGKPREYGPDGEPEVFGAGLNGQNYHGSTVGASAKVHSTMGGSKP